VLARAIHLTQPFTLHSRKHIQPHVHVISPREIKCAYSCMGLESKNVGTWRFDLIIPPILDILYSTASAFSRRHSLLDTPQETKWKYKKNSSTSNM
jgi:hypothetical protein